MTALASQFFVVRLRFVHSVHKTAKIHANLSSTKNFCQCRREYVLRTAQEVQSYCKVDYIRPIRTDGSKCVQQE